VPLRAVPLSARAHVERHLRAADSVLVLRELPDEAMRTLLEGMTRVEVAAGEQLFEQGDEGDAMFLLEQGQLLLHRRLSPEDEHELHVATLGPGSLVGDMALLYDEPRTASAVAQGPHNASLWRLCRLHFASVIADLRGAGPEDEEACEIDFENVKSIFVVSDGTGETCAKTLALALKQFDLCYQGAHGYTLSTFPYVREKEEVLEITRRARAEGALVVYTLMQPQAREVMRAEVARQLSAGEGELRALDLWEPLLVQLEDLLGARRQVEVSEVARRPVGETCLRMIDAIEYAQKMDDGVLPHLWGEADILLVGLSRAGKTPLSYFLAQRGYKVANYPVVPDEEPPEELFHPEIQEKCVALFITPERLQNVRNERMKEYGRRGSAYSSLTTCAKEVSWLKTFCARKGPRWPVVDTTNGSVEESAAKVLRVIERRAGVRSVPALSPSVC